MQGNLLKIKKIKKQKKKDKVLSKISLHRLAGFLKDELSHSTENYP